MRGRKSQISSWLDFKNVLREIYAHNIQERVNPPTPKTKTKFKRCGGIFKEMEMFSVKNGLEETYESNLARFLNRLNQEIQDVIQLQRHDSLEEMLNQAIKVESKIKRHHTFQKYSSCSASWDEDKTSQGKYLKLSSSSKNHRPSSSSIEKYSSQQNHVSYSSSIKPKFKEKISSIKCFVLGLWTQSFQLSK